MSGSLEDLDVVVVGAGLRGLAAALRQRRELPHARLLVVDAAPQPGGSIRSQRTNGFVCELGPFALPITALTPVLDLLQRPPVPIPCEPGARIGHLFTGDRLEPIPVEPLPLSFRSGTEEVVQACRRELDGVFRLGRAVVGIDRDDIFVVTFGGEVRSQLRCPRLVLALPVAALARLLGRFDPALAPVADRLVTTPAAFAFLAGNRSDAPELRGYGILPAETLETPVREVIFCSEVFAGRALPGRFLVRVECDAAAGSDEDVLALAERELRRWSGTRAELGLRKLHRFDDIVPDGALAECRARLQGIGQRVPGLTIL